MGLKRTDAFRQDAVRIALTSGLTRKQVADDLGVGRLMRQNGISVVRTRKHRVTTDSNHKFNIAPNLLDRDFVAEHPNRKWAGDITYVWTCEGWLYLALDHCPRTNGGQGLAPGPAFQTGHRLGSE